MSEMRVDHVQNAMQQFSRPTRRFLALAVLFLALFGTWKIVLAPIIGQMNTSLTKLEDARFQRMRLESIQARPAPKKVEPVPSGMVLRAKDRKEAETQLGGYLLNLAAQNGLEITSVKPRLGVKRVNILSIDFALSGDETGIAQFVNGLERGSPAIRFRSWQIDSASIAGVSNEVDEMATSGVAEGRQKIQFSGRAIGTWIKS